MKTKTSFGVSYYGSHFSEDIKNNLLEIKEHGCNHIIFAASEFDMDFYYKSSKELVEIAHELNIKVILDLWAHGGAFGGEGGSFFLMNNPDTRQISNLNNIITKSCFNNKKFQDFIKNSVIKGIELGVDGFFWDEPAFHTSKDGKEICCFCSSCKKSFKEMFNKEMPMDLTEEVIEFRKNSLVSFLTHFSNLIKETKKAVEVSVCVFPAEKDPTISWEKISNIKSIDTFGSDPYWLRRGEEVGYVKRVSEKVVNVAKKYNKKSQIWIQLYRIPKGKEDEIIKAVENAYSKNPDYITAWTFRAAAGSLLECTDWKKCWDNLGKVYRNLKKKK